MSLIFLYLFESGITSYLDTDLNGKELLQSNARTMNGHDVVLCSTDVQAACDAPDVGTESIHPEEENKTLLAAGILIYLVLLAIFVVTV
mgnify:CR=1 FL=1